ncbi:MAG: hypothetical protein OEM52_03515 [bacterium]|nr:hypothetical protein [bacterium]
MRLKFILLIVCLLFSISAKAQDVSKLRLLSIDPNVDRLVTVTLPVDSLSDYFPLFPSGKVSYEMLKANKYALLSELNNSKSLYRCSKIEANGKITLLTSFLGVRGSHYVVQSDFVQWATKRVRGEYTKIGYLIRIQADIRDVKGEIDLGSLFAVGVAAQLSKISGSLEVQIYGLTGPLISQTINRSFALSEESLLKAIEDAAVVKSKLSDPELILFPAILPDDVDTYGKELKNPSQR